MIHLFTGAPGAGKTALAVSELLKVKDRPLFVMGVPDLRLKHHKVPPISDWTEQKPSEDDPSLLVPSFTFPPNSIIVIDEAQNVYRPRGSGAKVPDHVAAFETHRHTGVDFWLITQHPGLIDANVRKLVSRHVHIRVTPLGRYAYEWPEASDPDRRSTAVKRKYTLDRKAFTQYKSAEVHTKHKHALPIALFVLLVAAILAAYLGYRIYTRADEIAAPDPVKPTGSAAAQQPTSPGGADQQQRVFTLSDFATPVPGRPEYAPAYDEIRKPKYMPIVSACVASASSCLCYTQQGTQVDDVTQDQCQTFVKKGSFNPYDSAVLVAASPPPVSPGEKFADQKSLDPPPSEVVQPQFRSLPQDVTGSS